MPRKETSFASCHRFTLQKFSMRNQIKPEKQPKNYISANHFPVCAEIFLCWPKIREKLKQHEMKHGKSNFGYIKCGNFQKLPRPYILNFWRVTCVAIRCILSRIAKKKNFSDDLGLIPGTQNPGWSFSFSIVRTVRTGLLGRYSF